MQIQSLFFKKCETKGKKKQSTTQGKSIPMLKLKTFNSSSNNKQLLASAQVLLRGSSKWPAQCVALQKFQRTHASQAGHNARGQGSCSRSGCCWTRLRKQRWPLCTQCVGLCTPFPSKRTQHRQKSGSLAGFNGRMM